MVMPCTFIVHDKQEIVFEVIGCFESLFTCPDSREAIIYNFFTDPFFL